MALQTTTFTQNVRTLFRLEEEIHVIQEKLRELRKQKNNSEEEIMAIMAERKLLNIDVGKYVLSMAEKKHYSALSFTYLEKTLSQIIPDKAQKDYVMKYLKDNRETKLRNGVVFAHK